MSGFGAWHFFSGGLCVSEFLHGSYTYNYAAFGPGDIMHTPALFGASQGLMDYAALKRAESTPEAAAIVAEIRQEARKLRTATEPQVLSWYREKGEKLLEKVREVLGF